LLNSFKIHKKKLPDVHEIGTARRVDEKHDNFEKFINKFEQDNRITVKQENG
jgi:hypothetical protein